MRLSLALIVLLFCSAPCWATNRYVRNDGGTTVQCTGLADSAYDGSGSGEACAYAVPQDAHNAASCGDTIFLKATHTWTTTGPSNSVLTINKECTEGSPLTIKSTLADTLAQARPTTLIPSGADLAKMANLLAVGGAGGGTGPILVQSPAAHIIFDGLHLTANPTGDNSVNALFQLESGHHVTVQRSYSHPPETTSGTSELWERSVERGFAIGTDDVTIKWGYHGPFVGYSKGSCPGSCSLITSEVAQCVTCQRLTIKDNYLNAHYAMLFLGGGDTGPGHTTTMSSITGTTGATLAATTHLTAGIIIRVSVTGVGSLVGDTLTRTSGAALTSGAINDGITLQAVGGGTTYFNGVLQSVAGDVYGISTPQDPPNGNYDYTLFQTVIVDTVNGGTGEVTWTPYGPNALSQAPVGPGQAAYADGDESLVNDVLVQRNIIEADYAFSAFHKGLGGNGPKGYCEVKNANRMTWEGNVHLGFPSSPVWFGTNQSGTAPWITVKNFDIFNNFYNPTPYASDFGPYMAFVILQGDTYTSTPGGNVEIYNNLALNQGLIMRISDGSTVSVYHNTVLPDPDGVDFNTSVAATGVTGGVVTIRDNIASFRGGALKCTIDGNLATCWPGTRAITNNVFVDEQLIGGFDINLYGTNSMLAPIPDEFSDVGFVDLATCLTGTIASCALAGGSAYKGDGTAGADPGCNIGTLLTALGPQGGGQNVTIGGRVLVGGRATWQD